MAATIWKFPLEAVENQIIIMPVGAIVLTVAMQYQTPTLWALVDPSAVGGVGRRKIAIYGTGHPLPEDYGVYINTFQMAGGDLVFHVFDLGEE